MSAHTVPGRWLIKHGWTLRSTRNHGYATTHYWQSPDGKEVHTQTYALITQRSRNKAEREAARRRDEAARIAAEVPA